jgi:hypothetical protein
MYGPPKAGVSGQDLEIVNQLMSVLATDAAEMEVEDEAQAERRADKARIKALEARLAKLEREKKGKGRGKYARCPESNTH